MKAARKAWEAEKDAVDRQITATKDSINLLVLNVTAARNDLKPAVGILVRLAANAAWTETGTIETHLKPQVHKKDRSVLDDQLTDDDATIDDLDNVGQTGDLTGADLKSRMEDVENVRDMNSNRILLAEANKLIGDYQKNYNNYLWKASARLWDAGASSYTFSDDWSRFEEAIADDAYALNEIAAKHCPSTRLIGTDMADGGSFLQAVKSAIAKINNKITNKVKSIEPRAAAAEKLEALVAELKRVQPQEEAACYAALPSMKEALVRKRTADEMGRLLTKAEADLKAWSESSTINGTAASYTAQQTALETLPARIRAQVEPKWFNYSTDLEELAAHIGANLDDEDGFTIKDLAQANTQIRLAALLYKYDNWFELIKGARSAIEEDADAERQAKSKKYLNEFETQVNRDLKTELGGLIDPDKMQDMWAKLDSIKNDVELLASGPGAKDAMEDFDKKYLPKLANDAAWKLVIKEEGWRKKLGTFRGGINKATKGVGLLLNAKKIVSSGDTVSLVDGSGHPAIDGLSACLDAINTFNKVPVLNVLIDFYVVALGTMTKSLAVISKKMAEKRLQFAQIDGYLTGPVMR